MKHQAYHIQWIDSETYTSFWIFDKDISGILEIETVGYVVKENERSISVASTIANECFGGVITIPKIAITKMKKVSINEKSTRTNKA